MEGIQEKNRKEMIRDEVVCERQMTSFFIINCNDIFFISGKEKGESS